MIYLDNAATTLHKPTQVVDAVCYAMTHMGNSSRGTHGSALTASRTIYGARERVAALFHCRADHVCFAMNATEALNIALSGLINYGDHVISTDCEHNSVLRPLYRLQEERGVALDFVKADGRGLVDPAAFDGLIRPETRAIVCTHASNLTGNVLDIGRIGNVAKAHGLRFIVDAAQTAGVFPVDMERMHIDALCFTGHKSLMGPQGTGGVCVGEGVRIRPYTVGGTGIQSYSLTQPPQYPTALEAGTLNGHGIAGLSAALDFIRETGMDRIREKEQRLSKRFYDGVSQLPGIRIYGDFSHWNRAPVISLNIWDMDSGTVSDALFAEYDIATRPGAHCAPRLHEALGTKNTGAVRFSFSWYNTQGEIDTAIQAVGELADRFGD